MSYAPGRIAWVDLASPDAKASAEFYQDLFGWTADIAPEPEAQGYTTFRTGGKAVAAVGQQMSPDQPPAWTTYFATDDVDATTANVRAAGGNVVMEPMDVMGYGRMAVYLDPAGAAFAVWQAGSMSGAEVMGETNSLGWNELMSRDAAAAKAFYQQVLGVTPRDIAMEDATYTLWELGGTAVGGMMPMDGDMWPPDLPSHWMVYFNVDDTDAIAAKAESLGGTVSVPPTDTPAGRFAVLGDPQGAHFSVIKPDPDFQP
ncbi:MAG: VOC family protein [Sporichthyaceae bacterium]|nr:VOC family protein [Sporichthyaceae bacterium]